MVTFTIHSAVGQYSRELEGVQRKVFMGAKEKTDKATSSISLHIVGRKALAVYHTFTLEGSQNMQLSVTMGTVCRKGMRPLKDTDLLCTGKQQNQV